MWPFNKKEQKEQKELSNEKHPNWYAPITAKEAYEKIAPTHDDALSMAYLQINEAVMCYKSHCFIPTDMTRVSVLLKLKDDGFVILKPKTITKPPISSIHETVFPIHTYVFIGWGETVQNWESNI